MSTRDLVYIALFAAITAALALFPPIMLPLGVPITAQSLGPMLAGSILGFKRGGLSQLLLVVLVAIGMPLLPGGSGGLGIMIGPTGGFIIGWVVGAFVTGYMTERFWSNLNFLRAAVACFAGGIVAVYVVGVPWMAVVAGMSLPQASAAMVPFIPGDLVKVATASLIATAIKRSYPLIEIRVAT